jgi:hypothetical protein
MTRVPSSLGAHSIAYFETRSRAHVEELTDRRIFSYNFRVGPHLRDAEEKKGRSIEMFEKVKEPGDGLYSPRENGEYPPYSLLSQPYSSNVQEQTRLRSQNN